MTYGHMSNRLAVMSAEDAGLVVKIFEWVLFEELIITFKEIVVVPDGNTECSGVNKVLG